MKSFKKMKLIACVGMVAVMAFTAVSCSDEMVEEKKGPGEGRGKFEVTLSGSIASSETGGRQNARSTRAITQPDEACGLKTLWKVGDKITVGYNAYNNIKKTVDMTVKSVDANGVATFQGEVENMWDKQSFQQSKLFAVNNEDNDNITANVEPYASHYLQVDVDFSGQNGKPENIANYDLLYAEGKAAQRLNFSHKTAVMRLGLKPANGSSGSLSGLSFFYKPNVSTAGTSLFAGKQTFKFGESPEEKYEANSFLSLSETSIGQSNGKAQVYVAVPSNGKLYGTLSVQATFAGDTYRKELNLKGQAFPAQHVVAKDITLKSDERAPKVGDYLYSDGSWGPLVHYADKVPVALIFSNYTSPTDRANGFTHGYAIALRDAAWPTAWCPLNLRKDFPETDNLFRNIDATAPLMMMNNLDGLTTSNTLYEKYLKGYGWNEHYGNRKPTAAITVAKEYGGSAWRKAFTDVTVDVPTPPNTSGWYLPSIGQWFLVFKNLSGLDPDKLEGALYPGTEHIYCFSWLFRSAEERNNYLRKFRDYFSSSKNPILDKYRSEGRIPQSEFYLPHEGQILWYLWSCDEAMDGTVACCVRLTETELGFTYLDKMQGIYQENGYAARSVIAF
uniref:Lipoprotein n=1 Tax=Prevotella sp. GTC17262 TaxID=3236797 RepID=A0AB33JUV4_9BACT